MHYLSPGRWCDCFSTMETLKDGQFVQGFVLDYWLELFWLEFGRPRPRYIGLDWISHDQPFSNEQIEEFRTFHDLPLEGPCDMDPLIALVNDPLETGQPGDSTQWGVFCCALWLPDEGKVHIIGLNRDVDESSFHSPKWDNRLGPKLWARITELHGWDLPEPEVLSVNWIFKDFDSGLVACRVMESIWTKGFTQSQDGFWRRPQFECMHTMRITLGLQVMPALVDACDRYSQLTPFLKDSWPFVPPDEIVDMLRVDGGSRTTRDVMKNLRRAVKDCKECPSQLLSSRHDNMRYEKADETAIQQEAGDAREEPVEVDDGMAAQQEAGDAEEEPVEVGNSGRSDSESNGGQSPSAATLNKNFHVKDRSQAILGRFPRPRPAPELPPLQTLVGLWKTFYAGYDDYEGGPTIDTLEPIEQTIIQLASKDVVYCANRIVNNPWESFKDYGWRCNPSFSDLFHHLDPVLVESHLMTVGLDYPTTPFADVEDMGCSRSGDVIEAEDLRVMGASDMLKYADDVGSDEVFLTGKSHDGLYIRLDLQRDAVEPCDLVHSFDIDSMGWMTCEPRFHQAVNVYTLPQIRDKAPIWKHNHLYVDLLYPPSEEDSLALGPRTEWETKRFRLCQLPHLALGKLGDGSGKLNVYMFFPRMTHQDPYTGRWSSMIPIDVQRRFWARVVTPAMKMVTDSINHPYVGLSEENMKLKGAMGGRGRGKGTKAATFPFGCDDFQNLCQAMRTVSTLYSLIEHHH
jgi:hypothetical protein